MDHAKATPEHDCCTPKEVKSNQEATVKDPVCGMSPNRKYAWILSRTPIMAPKLLLRGSLALKNQGFDTYKLLSTPKKGGLQEKIPLCTLESGR